MKVGDRVASKVSGKKGTIVSISIPLDRARYGLLYATVLRDDGSKENDKLSNFVPEDEYKEIKFDPIGDNRKDAVEMLTPADKESVDGDKELQEEEQLQFDAPKKKKGRKSKTEEGASIEDIVQGTIAEL